MAFPFSEGGEKPAAPHSLPQKLHNPHSCLGLGASILASVARSGLCLCMAPPATVSLSPKHTWHLQKDQYQPQERSHMQLAARLLAENHLLLQKRPGGAEIVSLDVNITLRRSEDCTVANWVV